MQDNIRLINSTSNCLYTDNMLKGLRHYNTLLLTVL